MTALRVPVRELKARLSHYLARAQAGEAIEITSRNKVVARLTPAASIETSGLERVVETGEAAWSGGKPKGAAIRLVEGGKSVSHMVLEDRG